LNVVFFTKDWAALAKHWTQSASAQYSLAAGIGFLAALLIFPGWYFTGLAPFDRAMPGDVAQHIISQRYYFADSWHWPLTRTVLLLRPDGMNISLTDGIPLEAMFFKLFAALLPPHFEGVTIWVVFAAVSQPVAAVFALRGAGKTDFFIVLLVSLLAIGMPLQPMRFYHAALSTHSILLVAIGLYIRVTTNPSLRGIVMAAILPTIALAIHPYLAVLTFAVTGAIPVTLAARRGTPAMGLAFAGICGSLALFAIAAIMLGYMGASLQGTGGFGQNPLPILSPVVPSMSALFGGATVDGLADVHAGQSEYLGAGVLLLALVAGFAVFWRSGGVARIVRDHVGMVAVCTALYVLAIMNNITIISGVLFTIPIPYFILRHLDQLRANDRFFWPVSYVMFVTVTIAVSRIRPWRAAVTILTVATVLEVADAAKVRQWVEVQTEEQQPWSIDADRIRALTSDSSRMTVWPLTACTNDRHSIMDVLLLASERLLDVNTMLLSRGGGADGCDPRRVLSAPLAAGELRLIVPPAGRNLASLVPDWPEFCRSIGSAVACARSIQRFPGLSAVTWDAPVPSERLLFGLGQTGLRYTAAGWAPAALADGIWSEGKEAVLLVAKPQGNGGPNRMYIEVSGYGPVKGSEQSVDIVVGGVAVGTWQVPDLTPTVLSFDLPPADNSPIPREVRFRIAHPTQPSSRREWGGTAQRGLFLRAMSVK
jgi:hypothetical protein